MEHDHLIAMLNRLKLTAIRDQLDSLVDEAARRELTIREALSLFCEREIARKDERRIEMGIGLARFPFVRDFDSFDFAAQPSIDKKQIREIATGRFIANTEAVLLLGPPGRRQNASGSGDRAPGDPDRLHRAVCAGADPGGPARQGAQRGPTRRPPYSLWQSETADRRRARLSPVRAQCSPSVLSAGVAALRTGQRADHQQSLDR